MVSSHAAADPRLQAVVECALREVREINRRSCEIIRAYSVDEIVGDAVHPFDVLLNGWRSNVDLLRHGVQQRFKNSLETRRGIVMEQVARAALVAYNPQAQVGTVTDGPDFTLTRAPYYYVGEIKSGKGNGLNASGFEQLRKNLAGWCKKKPSGSYPFRSVLLHLFGRHSPSDRTDKHPHIVRHGTDSWAFILDGHVEPAIFLRSVYAAVEVEAKPFQGLIGGAIQEKVDQLVAECNDARRDLAHEILGYHQPSSPGSRKRAADVLHAAKGDPEPGTRIDLSDTVHLLSVGETATWVRRRRGEKGMLGLAVVKAEDGKEHAISLSADEVVRID